ncbi:MAG TPA: AAA family ATPase [Streptosporangiaceae bacterium]|nr:AAA family ATPase [Streptosporangiaceae bacterium]
MGAGEMAPGQVPDGEASVRAEVVHSSERTRVTRLFLPEGTVICKEPLGPDVERRVRHEMVMLQRLRGVTGVAQLAEAPRRPGPIVLADAGQVSLAGVASPLSADELAEMAVGLARAVAGMHARGVMHRDITPANVVLSGGGVPCLVDFALATSLAEIRPEFTHHTRIAGTLAYLAPEQTGRTGRPVDHRADLYALGATLYELATGQPPFGAGDPLRLTHDHLARVPVPPVERNPAISGALSRVIMHLLEKEPDNRYQTAYGVVHDLERLRDSRAHPSAAAVFRAGEQDVPLRLVPPSRLVGREAQVAALEEAFEQALAGRCRVLLISGAPGVGKTALADELRPVVTGRDGWFVAGKFDQYRRDLEFDGVYQAFRALGRLLLAEPEQELAGVRERIMAAAGANAGLAAAIVPEFAALLPVPPDPGDPLTAQLRAQRVSVQLLRAVASQERPLVFFVDDLQWAGRTPLGLFDLALSEEPVEGLLLVGAYREQDVEATHLLAPMVARWQRQQAGLHQVSLEDLPVPGLAAIVAEMLHVDHAAAAALADVISPYTSGNPYQTVELLNALRRDGVLAATAAGWRWDAAAVRAHLRRSDVAGLLAGRVAALPAQSRALLEAMACLGGRAGLSLLQAATSEPAVTVEQALAPALDDGLLVMEPGTDEAVRFRHDRIREAILDQVDPQRRRTMQLAMARRLAGMPELSAVAAEQYLPVVGAIAGAAERRQVAGLLRRAAGQAAMIGDYALVNALLSAAARLIDPGETATLIEVHTARHAALFSLGRLDEADEEYRTIEQRCRTALDRADATAVQVRSLTHRNRLAEAIRLGLESLRELGVAVPAADQLPAELDQQFGYLYRWLDHTSAADDLVRPETTDPAVLAAARVINAAFPGAYVAGEYAMVLWLTLETLRIWLEHGPDRTLLGSASTAAFHAVAHRGDHSGGYRALRRLLEVGEARGYEPDTSQARYLFAAISYWFEPIENGVQAAQQAREGLIAGGDLAMAGYTYATAAAYLVDCAPTLESLAAEVEAGLAFVRRTGDEMMGQVLDDYGWLAGVLRGERSAATGEAATTGRYADNPLALLYSHVYRAIAAAIFGNPEDLARHTAAAMPLLSATPGTYLTPVGYLLRGLDLSEQARATDSDENERGGLLSELDDVTGWLAARAADEPDNFLHLLRLLEAERAWADGDFLAAALAFDTARREVARRQRPWHRALITERAGRFHLTHGLDHFGYDLLAQARQDYASWGATAKVAQLDWAYPTLRPGAHTTAGSGASHSYPPHNRGTVTTGTIDLLGILSASQALSSETSIGRLHARVREVLGAMTGATGVHLLLWSEDRQDWLLPGSESGGAPVSSTGREHAVPMSVLRYAQRTREPLVAADATRDDRFARDPYFADVGCCALLAVPIVSRGALRAVLVLENRLIRGAFSTERLDAVQLIAGQLAVSLDNAQLYAELTASRARIVTVADQARRRIERDLHDGAQQRLVSLALQLRAVQATMPPEVGAQLDQVADGLTGALEELREIARGIHPSVLADGGLRPALKTLARRSPVPVDLDIRAQQRLPEQVEVSAYYVVAEALTNAAKHARASSVTVTAEADAVVLRVAVRDDGAGGADFTRGTGLVGLKDRVEAIGGRLFLDSPPGAGTSLRAEFPLAPPTATTAASFG